MRVHHRVATRSIAAGDSLDAIEQLAMHRLLVTLAVAVQHEARIGRHIAPHRLLAAVDIRLRRHIRRGVALGAGAMRGAIDVGLLVRLHRIGVEPHLPHPRMLRLGGGAMRFRISVPGIEQRLLHPLVIVARFAQIEALPFFIVVPARHRRVMDRGAAIAGHAGGQAHIIAFADRQTVAVAGLGLTIGITGRSGIGFGTAPRRDRGSSRQLSRRILSPIPPKRPSPLYGGSWVCRGFFSNGRSGITVRRRPRLRRLLRITRGLAP